MRAVASDERATPGSGSAIRLHRSTRTGRRCDRSAASTHRSSASGVSGSKRGICPITSAAPYFSIAEPVLVVRLADHDDARDAQHPAAQRLDRQQRVIDGAERRARDHDDTGRSSASIRSAIVSRSLIGTSTPPAPSTIQRVGSMRARSVARIDRLTSDRTVMRVPARRAARCGDTGSRQPHPASRRSLRRPDSAPQPRHLERCRRPCSMPGLNRFPVTERHLGTIAEQERGRDDGLADVRVGARHEEPAKHRHSRDGRAPAISALNERCKCASSSSGSTFTETRRRARAGGTVGGRIARTSKPSACSASATATARVVVADETGTMCDVPGATAACPPEPGGVRRSRARSSTAARRCGSSLDEIEARVERGGDRGRRRRGEDERPRALDQVVDRPRRPRDEGAADTERLACGVHREEHGVARRPALRSDRCHARRRRRPRALRRRSGARRSPAELGVRRERRLVAVHAEERLDDEKALPGLTG